MSIKAKDIERLFNEHRTDVDVDPESCKIFAKLLPRTGITLAQLHPIVDMMLPGPRELMPSEREVLCLACSHALLDLGCGYCPDLVAILVRVLQFGSHPVRHRSIKGGP